MNIALNILTAIVVENFAHESSRQMVIARLQGLPPDTLAYLYFNTALFPIIGFGDTINYNTDTGDSHVSYGNSRLTYKLKTYPAPLILLHSLIMNQPSASARGC